VLLLLSLSFYVYHKFITPITLKNNYTVNDVKKETHNVWTLTFKPTEKQTPLDYKPGQFQFITLHRNRNLPVEEHHFTISSSPSQAGEHTSSIKESGDFTATIGQTQIGDKVTIEAPFGRFSHGFHPEDKNFVFVAGGIGITPIISMIRHMKSEEKNVPVLLIYANKTEKDIAFRNELDAISQSEIPQLNIVHVLEHPDSDWQGEKGYVNNEILTKTIDSFENKAYYICCPPAMRKTVLKLLKSNGVKDKQIRVEIFAL
jgi:predicted ferric reductase